MALGLGLGISRGAFVSSVTLGQTIAQTHYDRVVADGGVLPVGVAGLSPILDSIIAAYSITNSTDFNTKVPVFLDPSYTGYKLGAGSGTTLGQAAQTVYSVYAGIPQVSDSDAQSFIYRVYTAGGELTTTEANATNQLVLDMKAAGIWTSMKAVYPMVGASAAACAQNLKSSSFTGSFSSGWTFASSGVTSNGVSSYFDSKVNITTDLNPINYGAGFYKINNTPTSEADLGANSANFNIYSNYDASTTYHRGISASPDNYTNYICNGFFHQYGKISASTAFLANVKKLTGGTGNISGTSSVCLAGNIVAGSTNSKYAFMFLSESLDDTQAAALYNNVQTFQTTLSRQV